MSLKNISIILVNTSHPGNIGAVARAMKTMGLSQLILVNPVQQPNSHTTAMAAGATDILANLKIVDSLAEAIAGCSLTIAASARLRTLSWPMLTVPESASQLVTEAAHTPVGLIFGRESSGLTNQELQLANYHVTIDANPDYSSLNIAMAVQVFSYEIYQAKLKQHPSSILSSTDPQADYPAHQQIEQFYHQLEQLLKRTGFIVSAHPGKVMDKIRRIFNRARTTTLELNILRGILSSIEKQLGK